MSKLKVFAKSLMQQSGERGWMLTLIACCCALMAVICLCVGMVVAYKALAHASVPIQQPAAMFAVGMFMFVATNSMWNYERWGRNLAVAITACMAWVMAEALQRLYGFGAGAKLPVVLFVALSLAYFTSPTGRILFRKKDESSDQEAGHEVVG